MNGKNICRLGCICVLSCLVLNAFADDSKNSAVSTLKHLFPFVSAKKIENAVTAIKEKSEYLAKETKRLNDIRLDTIKKMQAGKTLTYEQEKTLGIKTIDASNKYQMKCASFPLFGTTLKRYFWLHHTAYIYNGKTYFAPNSIEVSKPRIVSSDSPYKLIYQSHSNSMGVAIVKIKKSGNQKILGIELPTEIDILLEYSAHGVFPKETKNGQAILRFSSNPKKADKIYTLGDFSLDINE